MFLHSFRWVTCQLEILRPCLPPSVRRTIEELPGDLDATYERILEKIPSVNRVYTHRLLQCLSVAARPLEVEELAEVLTIEFDVMGGIPKLTEDFRWENQEQAVLSACSSLAVIVNYRGSRRVQFSHFSVLEFLSSDRLANSESSALSYYYIQRESAHAVMTQACLGTLLRLGDHMDKETIESYPLADYAGEFFVAHAKVGEVLSKINNGVDNLLDPDRPHINTWLWLQSFDWDSQYFDLNPDSSSDFGDQYSDQSNSEYPIYPPRVSPLYYTLLFGHTYLAQYLIRNRPGDLGATDICGRTALHIAAFKSDFDVVQMLVDAAHIAVNCRDNKDCTPLHYAMYDGDQESHEDVSRCVELLLERGADVVAQNNRGSTPLHLAASNMSGKTIRLLIKNGAKINLQNSKNQTALHIASRRGHLDIVRLLLDHKADIDLQDNHGSTPLHLAIYHMSREAVQLFLDHGANVTLRNDKGQAVLHQASQHGHPDVIQLILSGADADAVDNDGSTPLHLAVSEAEVLSGTQLLLDHGANINLRNKRGQTALHLASQRGRLDFMELLLNRGAIVDVLDNGGFTPLHLAISKMERRGAELLLKHGANIDLRNNKHQTALHLALQHSHPNIIPLLLEKGANVDAQDDDGSTPLHRAISRADVELSRVELLLDRCTNINLRNNKGQTALHLASQHGRINIMRLLLEDGADVDAPDSGGSTALHQAISDVDFSHLEQAVGLLLCRGANINLRNGQGQTALYKASLRGYPNIIHLMRKHRPDVDTRITMVRPHSSSSPLPLPLLPPLLPPNPNPLLHPSESKSPPHPSDLTSPSIVNHARKFNAIPPEALGQD
jgi:ankyrin repeat protein